MGKTPESPKRNERSEPKRVRACSHECEVLARMSEWQAKRRIGASACQANSHIAMRKWFATINVYCGNAL